MYAASAADAKQPRVVGAPQEEAGGSLFGFYVLQRKKRDEEGQGEGAAPDPGHGARRVLRAEEVSILYASCFSPACEVTCCLQLDPQQGDDLVLMPTTFGPAECGAFSLVVHSNRPLALTEL